MFSKLPFSKFSFKYLFDKTTINSMTNSTINSKINTNYKSMFAFMILAFIFLQFNPVLSQDKDAIINENLILVAKGKAQEVKAKLPDLLVEYPNYAGVKLLLAVVVEDASKAVNIYKDIVENHSDNIWADDAFWRLIQYYAITGEISKAKEELERFRTNYPTSPFIVSTAETVRFAESVVKYNTNKIATNNQLNTNPNSNNKPVDSELIVLTGKPDESKLEEKIEEPKTEIKSEPKLENKLEKFKPKKQEVTEEEETEESENAVDAKKLNQHLSVNQDNKAKNENDHSHDGNHDENHDGNHEGELVVLTNKQPSLEDEIKVRQNISKQLVSGKIEEEKRNVLEETPEVTTLTKVEEIEEKPKAFGLQVSIYSSQETAELEMKKYLKQRMRTEVRPKVVDGNKMYAVVIGNYSSRESAEGARPIVEQQCNCSPIIFEK